MGGPRRGAAGTRGVCTRWAQPGGSRTRVFWHIPVPLRDPGEQGLQPPCLAAAAEPPGTTC